MHLLGRAMPMPRVAAAHGWTYKGMDPTPAPLGDASIAPRRALGRGAYGVDALLAYSAVCGTFNTRIHPQP
jgi:hypothetical protein